MRRWRVRVEWKLEDAWMGAYWERQAWWGGTMDALEAATTDYEGDADAFKHRRFDLWVCLIPMVPIHVQSLWCPQPRECSSDRCWVREIGDISISAVVVPVIEGRATCMTCHGREWVHNLAMGPPHPSECSWCSIPCPSCQPVVQGRCAGCGHKEDHHHEDLTCLVRSCPCPEFVGDREVVPEPDDGGWLD